MKSSMLSGKTALVTGSTSGIGLGIARSLAEQGANIVFNGFGDAQQIEKLYTDIGAEFGVQTAYHNADMSKPGEIEAMMAYATEKFGGVDILVNNAGIIINKLVVDMTREDWERIQAVNATAAFLHCREAVKAMMPNRSGAIVNIASYASYFAFPTIAAYTASKGALAQLTRTLALEAIEHGIRVNAIGVGDVVTNILNDVVEDGPGFLAQHGEAAPIGRAAQPEEIAEVVAFLASERASFMVGSVVMADGGMTVTAG